MLSIPPATMTPRCLSAMFCAASMTDLRPDAQTLLMVVASVLSGMLQQASASCPMTRRHSFRLVPRQANLIISHPRPSHSPRRNNNLPRGALAHTGLHDIAEVHLFDAVRLDAGALNGGLDGDGAELGRSEGREGAVDAADGRAGRRENVDVLGGLRGCQGRVSRGDADARWVGVLRLVRLPVRRLLCGTM